MITISTTLKEWLLTSEIKTTKPEKIYKKDETLFTILKSFDTFVIIATTSSSVTLSLTEIGLIAIPISTAAACGLLNSKKIIYENVMQKHNKYKKQYEKDQQTMKSFDKLNRKSSQDNIIDKNEIESLCNFLLSTWTKQKMIFFENMNIKLKLFFFSNNDLKFNQETGT